MEVIIKSLADMVKTTSEELPKIGQKTNEMIEKIAHSSNSCLVPYSYGMIYNQLMEANLWEIYCTLMPRQRHESEKRYKNLKRASLS